MTGEITLRGRVLPIGSLKEKLLAAHRAGIRTFIMPKKNAKNLEEVPKKVLRDLTIIQVTTMEEVLQATLVTMPQPVAKPPSRKGRKKKKALPEEAPAPAS